MSIHVSAYLYINPLSPAFDAKPCFFKGENGGKITVKFLPLVIS